MIDYLLPILFFFVALIYSSVGLGGGSSYTALMAIFGISYQIIPPTSLTLNLIVTFIGLINFWRNGHGRFGLIFPFLVTSIPMAYLAGTLELPKDIFQILLLITLFLVVVRIYFLNNLKFSFQLSGIKKLIIMFGLGSEKEAATAGALFIWVNSLAGIIARAQGGAFNPEFILPLSGAVIVGGFTGSYWGSFKFEAKTIQKVMGAIIIIAIIFLFRKIL